MHAEASEGMIENDDADDTHDQGGDPQGCLVGASLTTETIKLGLRLAALDEGLERADAEQESQHQHQGIGRRDRHPPQEGVPHKPDVEQRPDKPPQAPQRRDRADPAPIRRDLVRLASAQAS